MFMRYVAIVGLLLTQLFAQGLDSLNQPKIGILTTKEDSTSGSQKLDTNAGQTEYVIRTGILGATYYSWALTADWLDDPLAATTVGLANAALSIYIPMKLNVDPKIRSAVAYSSWYGATRGPIVGLLINSMINKRNEELSYGSGAWGSVAGHALMYGVNHQTMWTRPEAEYVGLWGDFGMFSGALAGGLFSIQSRGDTPQWLTLGGHVLGLVVGNQLTHGREIAAGDAWAIRTTILATSAIPLGLAKWNPDWSERKSVFGGVLVASSLGMVLGEGLSRYRPMDLRDGVGTMVGVVGGGLMGAGMAALMTDQMTDQITDPMLWAMFVGSMGNLVWSWSQAGQKTASATQTTNWTWNAQPLALLKPEMAQAGAHAINIGYSF
jgi:hypothetical protein